MAHMSPSPGWSGRLVSSSRHPRSVRRRFGLFVLVGGLFGGAPATAEPANDTRHAPTPRETWLCFDGPLWDISDEGLPFVISLAQSSPLDPISRLLQGSENRWFLSLGYARAYDSYDDATGIFKNPGGHALMLGAGRQILWDPPAVLRPWVPRLSLSLGVNHATTPFKADGTRTNFIVQPGLEWQWTEHDRSHRWTAGIRWLHLSNGNLFRRNAGYDGLTFQIGRTVVF